MPLGASLTAKHRQKPLTVTIQLGLPDTADIQHLRGRLRSIHQHLLQRLVMENDIRRHVVLARDRLPARAQRFPQTEIFVGNDLLPGRLPRCHDDAFRVFAEKQWRLSTQDTTTGFCQDQRTVTGCIRSQVPGNDQLVAVVLGAAIAGGAAKAILLALLTSGESTSWLSLIINIAFYPFVIPAVLVGVYLRVLMQRGEEQARDFTAAEAEENWIKVAPHLLALWALCWMAVSLLTWLQSVPSAELGVFGRNCGGIHIHDQAVAVPDQPGHEHGSSLCGCEIAGCSPDAAPRYRTAVYSMQLPRRKVSFDPPLSLTVNRS